jgi:hypothetical protein
VAGRYSASTTNYPGKPFSFLIVETTTLCKTSDGSAPLNKYNTANYTCATYCNHKTNVAFATSQRTIGAVASQENCKIVSFRLIWANDIVCACIHNLKEYCFAVAIIE